MCEEIEVKINGLPVDFIAALEIAKILVDYHYNYPAELVGWHDDLDGNSLGKQSGDIEVHVEDYVFYFKLVTP